VDNLFELEIPYSGRRMKLYDLQGLYRLVLGGALFGIVMHFSRMVAAEVDRRVRIWDLGKHEEPEKEEPAGIRVVT